MEVVFTEQALADIRFWKKSGNFKIQKRISALILSVKESPFSGIGKPEPLKHNLAGHWSRRINEVHRLVYKTEGEIITIISARFHY